MVPVDEVRLVIVPEAEVRSSIVAVEMVVVANCEVPVTTKVFVVVAFTEVKLSIIPVRAWKILAKRLVEVEFVEDELIVKKLVEVLFLVVRLMIVAEATVRSEIVVVASVVVPVTVKRLDTDEVPAKRSMKLPFVVKKVSVKKLVAEALVKKPF